MAILKSQLPMTGSLGDLSFYTMAGSDKIIVRRKGGPSRKRVLTDWKFENTRLNAKEFAGRVLASQMFLRALTPMRQIFNYNVILALHKPLKKVQVLDPVNGKGRRGIAFSRKPVLFEGLSFSSKNALESVIRTPLESSLSPEGRAVVHIAELLPGYNLMLPEKYPYYRIVVGLAAVPDLHLQDGHYLSVASGLDYTLHTSVKTPWISASSAFAASQLEATLPVSAKDSFVWVLSVGLELGAVEELDAIWPVHRQGTGKVLKVVAAGQVG